MSASEHQAGSQPWNKARSLHVLRIGLNERLPNVLSFANRSGMGWAVRDLNPRPPACKAGSASTQGHSRPRPATHFALARAESGRRWLDLFGLRWTAQLILMFAPRSSVAMA
jgi:hypothetical protein